MFKVFMNGRIQIQKSCECICLEYQGDCPMTSCPLYTPFALFVFVPEYPSLPEAMISENC